jgi:hypothetical protein
MAPFKYLVYVTKQINPTYIEVFGMCEYGLWWKISCKYYWSDFKMHDGWTVLICNFVLKWSYWWRHPWVSFLRVSVVIRSTYSIVHGTGYLKNWLSLSLSESILLSYGTRRFITVFTQARHWTLSWASWIQFAPSIPISLRSILMLSSHLRLGLPSGLLPSGLPTKTL